MGDTSVYHIVSKMGDFHEYHIVSYRWNFRPYRSALVGTGQASFHYCCFMVYVVPGVTSPQEKIFLKNTGIFSHRRLQIANSKIVARLPIV